MPDVARGVTRQIHIGFEPTYLGNPASLFAIPNQSLSLGSNQNMIKSETQIPGQMDMTAPIAGTVSVTGSGVFPLDTIYIGYLLKALFGAPVTTFPDPKYIHTFKRGLTAPSIQVIDGYSSISEYRKFSGVKITGMDFKFVKNEEMKVTVNFSGAREDDDQTDRSVTIEVSDGFGANAITIDEGGSGLADIREFNLSIKSPVDEENGFTLDGNEYRSILVESGFEVFGNMRLLYKDVTLYNKAKNFTTSSLNVALTSGTNKLRFLMDEVKYSRSNLDPQGKGPVVLPLEFMAFYKEGANGTSLQIELENDKTSYA